MKIIFNVAKANYTSPAHLTMMARREAECRALEDCARIRPERMTMKTSRPK